MKDMSVNSRRFVALLALLQICFAIGCGASSTTSPPEKKEKDRSELTRWIDESMKKGRMFLVNIQKPEGNFTYEVNFVTGEVKENDNAIRQGGTLWSVASLHLYDPSDETRETIVRGLKYFEEKSQVTEDGRRYIVYPGTKQGSTGTVALVTLSLIEMLRAQPEHENAEMYRKQFDQYVKFLLSLRRDDAHFYRRYQHDTGKGYGDSLTYYDGETLLALCKAANYLDRKELEPLILESADAMFSKYFVNAVKTEDDDPRREFYQWGTMSFFEIYQTKWEGSEQYASRAIEMATWLHGLLKERPAKHNSGSYHEGLVSAWELARQSGDEKSKATLGDYVYKDLERLLGFQVGGPKPNKYIRKHTVAEDRFIGGTMFKMDDPWLRIDITQHHMHAYLLARKYMLKGK